MSDVLFEAIEEIKRWKKESPKWYSGKEFNRRYNATVKVMRSLALYVGVPEEKGESVWKHGMKGFKWRW